MRPLILAIALLATAGLPTELAAQASAEIESELRAMVEAPSPAERDRAVVRGFLERPDVEAAVASYGVDLKRARDRVGTLDASEANDLARRVEAVERQLAGGQVVITTSAIIIALLVVILLLLVD